MIEGLLLIIVGLGLGKIYILVECILYLIEYK